MTTTPVKPITVQLSEWAAAHRTLFRLDYNEDTKTMDVCINGTRYTTTDAANIFLPGGFEKNVGTAGATYAPPTTDTIEVVTEAGQDKIPANAMVTVQWTETVEFGYEKSFTVAELIEALGDQGDMFDDAGNLILRRLTGPLPDSLTASPLRSLLVDHEDEGAPETLGREVGLVKLNLG